MHPIQAYCERHDVSQKAFASQVDLSEGFISQLIKGHERCGRSAALKIVAATDGEIDLLALLSWEAESVRAAS